MRCDSYHLLWWNVKLYVTFRLIKKYKTALSILLVLCCAIMYLWFLFILGDSHRDELLFLDLTDENISCHWFRLSSLDPRPGMSIGDLSWLRNRLRNRLVTRNRWQLMIHSILGWLDVGLPAAHCNRLLDDSTVLNQSALDLNSYKHTADVQNGGYHHGTIFLSHMPLVAKKYA